MKTPKTLAITEVVDIQTKTCYSFVRRPRQSSGASEAELVKRNPVFYQGGAWQGWYGRRRSIAKPK